MPAVPPRSTVVPVRLDADADASVRVLVDPMATALTSVMELLGPLRSRVSPALVHRAYELSRPLNLRPLLDVVFADPFGSGVPDLLSPSARWSATFDDVLDRLRSVPSDDIVRGLERHLDGPGAAPPVFRRWLDAPAASMRRYCDSLDTYWHEVVCQVYPQPLGRLQHQARRLGILVDACGPALALASTHSRAVLTDSMLIRPLTTAVPDFNTGRKDKAPGLDLRPMISAARTSFDNLSTPGGTPFVAFSTPALTTTSGPVPASAGDPLPGLVGATRARVLRELARRPASPTGLAETLGVAPSTASHHLTVLTELAVVRRIAAAGQVVYELTERGERLLRL